MSVLARRATGVLSAAVFCLCILGTTFPCRVWADDSQSINKNRDKKKDPAKPDPTLPADPPAPRTLGEMPPTAPQVSYQSGQLTIDAQNSTLGDILRAVCNKTGALVDIPANATERVVGRLGPGPARDVLATLLNGSHFNYVLLGSASDPTAIEQIILTSKGGAASGAGSSQASPTVNTAGQPNAFPPVRVNRGLPSAVPEEVQDPGMDADNGGDNPDDNNATVDQADQPAADDQNPQEGAPQGLPAGQVKTPEQLLQELQRQQQLQQQQQQQGQSVQKPPRANDGVLPQPPNRPELQQQPQPQ